MDIDDDNEDHLAKEFESYAAVNYKDGEAAAPPEPAAKAAKAASDDPLADDDDDDDDITVDPSVDPLTDDDDDDDDVAKRGTEENPDDDDEIVVEEKPKKSAQRRFDEITRARRLAERERDTEREANIRLKEELAALKAGKKTEEQPAKKPAKSALSEAKDLGIDLSDLDKPDPANYEFAELSPEYTDALSTYMFEVNQRVAAKKSETKTAEKAVTEANQAAFDKNIAPALKDPTMPDFADVVLKGAAEKKWPLSDQLGQLLVESEHGARISYHLAKNVNKAKEVYDMTPAAQAKWLGKMEERLDAVKPKTGDGKDDKGGKTKTESRVIKLPDPVEKPRGRAKSDPDAATADFSTFEAMLDKSLGMGQPRSRR